MKLEFTKMQGAGNDFVVFDGVRQRIALTSAQLRRLADRHFGVGCDQILLVEAARMAEFQAVAAKIQGVRVEIAAKADETGSLYGSVGAAQIVAKLANAGHTIEERQVRLEHPLKALGEHQVAIHVHGDLDAAITVVVVAEAG